MAVDTIGSEASQGTEGAEEFKVRCPCGCNEVSTKNCSYLLEVCIIIKLV